MTDFENVFQFAFVLFTVIGLPTAMYVGYRYAMMWLRRYEREGQALHQVIEPEVLARVDRLEHEVVELHERLDFAERLLAQPQMDHLPPGLRT